MQLITSWAGKRRRPSVTFYLGEPSSREALYRKRKQGTVSRRISVATSKNAPFLSAHAETEMDASSPRSLSQGKADNSQ